MVGWLNWLSRLRLAKAALTARIDWSDFLLVTRLTEWRSGGGEVLRFVEITANRSKQSTWPQIPGQQIYSNKDCT